MFIRIGSGIRKIEYGVNLEVHFNRHYNDLIGGVL